MVAPTGRGEVEEVSLHPSWDGVRIWGLFVRTTEGGWGWTLGTTGGPSLPGWEDETVGVRDKRDPTEVEGELLEGRVGGCLCVITGGW